MIRSRSVTRFLRGIIQPLGALRRNGQDVSPHGLQRNAGHFVEVKLQTQHLSAFIANRFSLNQAVHALLNRFSCLQPDCPMPFPRQVNRFSLYDDWFAGVPATGPRRSQVTKRKTPIRPIFNVLV